MAYSWVNKRVLVTGGTGFVGSFLVEHLLSKKAKVRVPMRSTNYRALSRLRSEIEWVEGDLRDSEYCLDLVKDADYIFHLASHRRNTKFHAKKCSDVMSGNVQMSLALIDALRESDTQVPVTFFSTANVPTRSDVIALAQRESLDGFVLGKALCETLWFGASKQYNFPLLIVRPIGAYGPRDTFSKDSNVIPSLMLRARGNKDVLDVWGSGSQERAFLYVKDLIAAVFRLIDVEAHGIQYVTPPDVVAVRVLAKKIRDLVNPTLPIHFDEKRPEGTRSLSRLPMHESLHALSWTSLDHGLHETVEWWQSNR